MLLLLSVLLLATWHATFSSSSAASIVLLSANSPSPSSTLPSRNHDTMTANRETTLSEVQQIPRPTPAVLRASYVDRGLPPLPAHVSIPIAGEANSIIGAE